MTLHRIVELLEAEKASHDDEEHQEMYGYLLGIFQLQKDARRICPWCGLKVVGRRMCPRCGHFLDNADIYDEDLKEVVL